MIKVPSLKLINRDEWIIEHCRGKKVLHIGCTDYPVTQSKIENKEMLHQKILAVAKKVVGIDTDREGCEMMRQLMPNEDFIVHSAEKLTECEGLKKVPDFDIILAADVFEHLSNPGMFLDGAFELLHDHCRLLITTPQAFSIKRFLPMVFLGYEYVHADHKAYFSLSTMQSILSQHNLCIEEIYGFQWRHPAFRNCFANALVSPALRLSGGRLCDELALVVRRVSSHKIADVNGRVSE